MSGRAYTMREMKAIVEYLNTHKAYGEIRGRKLWTDFASSNLTSRTWQSLKETFLKRILPDIHNPYFGLSRSEICSFKQGYDVDARSNNKLEIQTISDESNHADNQDNEKPSTSNKSGDKATGENVSPSTLDARHRASTETIILENCYNSPEDIQRDLESPTSEKERNADVNETPSKSLRDLITYAEPLTPMMQQVLDDFATDESETETNLEIDENPQTSNNKTDNENGQQSENQNDMGKEKPEERVSDIVPTADSVKIPLGQETKIVESTSARNSYDLTENGTYNDSKKDESISINNKNRDKSEKLEDLPVQTGTTQNTNNSTDTTIPGNQEALHKNKEIALASENGDITKDITKKFVLSRQRSNSHDTNTSQGKKKVLALKNKKKSQSETEGKQKSGKDITNFLVKKNINEETKEQTADDKQDKEESNDNENNRNDVAHINPCLSSVSLYDEQFKKTKYTDSDSSDNSNSNAIVSAEKEADSKNKSPNVLKTAANVNDVVILKSHSESEESKEEKDTQEHINRVVVDKKEKIERDRALASVFGFATGAVSSSRKRKISRRQRSTSYNHPNASDSSEWTSESDSEYVSPPRGRRNRHSRKYLKPKSGRILSLEEEGGLFVMHGKRIYPLVKDGKAVKNYLTFTPDSDPEDDPNYWKKKYEEERKKTEELRRLVEEGKMPSLPATSRQPVMPQSPPQLVPIPDDEMLVAKEIPKQEVRAPEKMLKIKFTKNNEELQLEGHWSQLQPALADVVQIFNKDSELGKEIEAIKEPPPKETNGIADAEEILSIRSTPMDEESVRKKVEKMEEEIFKEIEELEKSEREQGGEQVSASTMEQDANVNRRKRVGRPRKSSTITKSADSSSSPSKPKIPKVGKKTEVANVPTERPRRQTNTPKKITSDTLTVTNGTDKKIPKKSPRKSSKQEPESTRPSSDDDSQVRYMFPPEKTQNARKSLSKVKTADARSLNIPANPTTDNLSLNSIESTQGYQDSDASPTKERMMLKRKRKLSLSIIHNRGKHRRYTRRKSYPCISDDASSESSNMSIKLANKNTSESIKSEIYRSESYQLFMPTKKRPSTTLSKIDEISPYNHHMDENDLKIQVEAFDLKNLSRCSSNVRTDGNSSNISLPLSPELSIVENISISKNLMNSIEDFPTINEMQAINESNSVAHNKYLMSAVDVTMPLMGQDCEIQKTTTPEHLIKSPTMSETVSMKINSVNLTEGPSISDSLDTRLRNLLLESAKKMEVDTSKIDNANSNITKRNTNNEKKPKGKTRCSTPNKRNTKKTSKIPDIEPVVEEERMEFCTFGGRKSCPPALEMFPHSIFENDNVNNIFKTGNKEVKKGRNKKDVIKVKILRPVNKQRKVNAVEAPNIKSHDVSVISVHTDSGINETGSALFLQDMDDSVDLIHNHSETCLQTRECITDSVEFVELNTSVISVHSQEAMEFKDAENIPPEGFCNKAHDGTASTRGKIISSQSTCGTVYHSPFGSDHSGTSLITEDLSDDANEMPAPSRSNKWYLFSDDETTNTNHAAGFGANLKQIFPLTCAVPDLSTITEMSKENDSRKPTLDADGDTRNDFDSQSMF